MFGKNKGQGGFTLVELLVVIAIIGVLSTMAVVQLRGGVDKALAAKNGREIHQLALALRIWMGNYQNHWMSECEIQNEFHGEPSEGKVPGTIEAPFCESACADGWVTCDPEPTIAWFIDNTEFYELLGDIDLNYEYDNDGDVQGYDSNGCMTGSPYRGASLYIQGIEDRNIIDGLLDGSTGANCGRFVWDSTPGRGIWKLGFTQDDF